jgi:DNA polymerase-1
MPIQGTAADMIKLAMIHLDHEIRQRELQCRMLLQVHDELVFEVQHDELAEMERLVKEKMQGALPLVVPVEVEIGTGKNWLEAH